MLISGGSWPYVEVMLLYFLKVSLQLCFYVHNVLHRIEHCLVVYNFLFVIIVFQCNAGGEPSTWCPSDESFVKLYVAIAMCRFVLILNAFYL